MSKILITPVLRSKDLKKFIFLQDFLQKEDPHYVPALFFERWQTLNPKKNPFYKHATVKKFLAWKDGKTAGRISAHIDHSNEKFKEEKIGCFGFFESIEDSEVSTALLETASYFLKSQGCKKIVGPLNFTTNEETGLLINGFEHLRMIAMPHNPPHYPALLESWGLKKRKDLYAWYYDSTIPVPEAPKQIANTVAQFPGLTIRNLNKKTLKKDFKIIVDVFNSAWSQNWGFVPFNEEEIKVAAKSLKLIADEELIFIAEVEGKPAAICVAIPNLYEILHDLKGRLFPLGWIKLFTRMKKHHFRSGRLMLLGVKKEYRGSVLGGLSVLLYVRLHEQGFKKGYHYGELSWTLEDNLKVNQGIEFMGGKIYKTYRIYEKEL